MEAIYNRRSVRNYLDKPIAENDVKLLLRAAMRAPSAGNEQPWEFIVLQDKTAIRAASEVSPYAKPLMGAPLAIVVCGNMERCKFPDEERNYWVQDCSAAIENILIEAHYLGLGSVWLGIYPNAKRVKDLSKLLDLPENVIPLGIVSIGYPLEILPPIDTFQQERIHYEKY